MKKRKLTRAIGLTLLGTTLMTVASPIGANAAWKQNSTGWWYTEGNSYATGWRQISGTWYYFDANGYMKTGWVKDGANWYYMNSNGAMQTGWVKDGYYWYYMNDSGAMQTGWIQSNGTWYFMNNNGTMKTGWHIENDKYYFLDEYTGAMKTGWHSFHPEVQGYFDKSGVAARGWTVINGKTYYFKEAGEGFIKAISEVVDGYYLDYSGVKQEGVEPKISSAEEAFKFVKEQDADFINKIEKENSNIELFSNYTTTDLNRFLAINGKDDILQEGAFRIVVEDMENYDMQYEYLVGMLSGKVYITKFGDRTIYEIKDNKVVNTYEQKKPDFDIEINATKWR